MKFDHLLQVYWLKGFLVGGEVFSFDLTSPALFRNLSNFGIYSQLNFIKKFEFSFNFWIKKTFTDLNDDEKRIFNMYFALSTSINHHYSEILRANSVRLFLSRTFRGKMQASRKPSRGQRTRSNANTAFKVDNIVVAFISSYNKAHPKPVVAKNLDFRFVEKKVRKKFARPRSKNKRPSERKVNLWV